MFRAFWTTLKRLFQSRRFHILLVIILLSLVGYFAFFKTITINPATEAKQMQSLETAKQQYELTEFVTDGCSGNVSKGWTTAITQLSKVSNAFAEKYAGTEVIPFEEACVEHDRAYHRGEGGYTARLKADNELRSAIIKYGIENTDTIQTRTGLDNPEEALFLYELVAESVYRGVRLGGAPCTGQPYAWGYGYNGGTCD